MKKSDSPAGIRDVIRGTIFHSVIERESVSSTNDIALSLADEGAEGGVVVIADSQTAGRGRQGRRWHSPPGTNVYLSLFLRPCIASADAPFLTVLSGIAVCRAVRTISGYPFSLKWPNDVMAGSRKAGGILIETRCEGRVVSAAVIGIGMNVNLTEDEIPPELKGVATSLRMETGITFERDIIIAGLIRSFDRMVSEHMGALPAFLDASAKGRLLEEWKALDSTLGRRVSVSIHGREIAGEAVDMDETGRLLVRTDDGRVVPVHAGDVRVLRW